MVTFDTFIKKRFVINGSKMGGNPRAKQSDEPVTECKNSCGHGS
jgi:hypothetical protein